MGEVSFRLLETVHGEQAARDAKEKLSRQVDAFEQRFDFGDEVFSGGLYGEQAAPLSYEPVSEAPPESFEQRIYRFAGRVCVVGIVNGVHTIEHREYWPDPEIPSEERLYVHVVDWTQDA